MHKYTNTQILKFKGGPRPGTMVHTYMYNGSHYTLQIDFTWAVPNYDCAKICTSQRAEYQIDQCIMYRSWVVKGIVSIEQWSHGTAQFASATKVLGRRRPLNVTEWGTAGRKIAQ